MEQFEAKLAKATNPDDGDLVGAFAIVVDSQGEGNYFTILKQATEEVESTN